MYRKFAAALACSAMLAVPAHADFRLMRWSTSIQEDPFDGKGRLTAAYFDSLKSGVMFICQKGSDEISLRVAFPFDSDQLGTAYDGAKVRIKIDNFDEITATATAVTLQNGNAGIDAPIYGYEAWQALENLRDGIKSLYLKIGDADTVSIPLTGSTAAAKQAIPFCLTDASKQKPAIDWSKEAASSTDGDAAPPIDETKRANALHNIASIQAIASLCPSRRPNDVLISAVASMWKIDLSEGSQDQQTIANDERDQIASVQDSLNKAGTDDVALAACTLADLFYGKDGTQLKNMVVPSP
ncbi:hypothetical protein [Martelella sp. HB161492]|uniref:hypothetical protein n=1 Tax=Martelella sp. HB161492 TaxID=2720726 RepID=UPI0015929F9D|nr:hypothetical protein [Martelella sp. HB161492]